MAWIQRMLIKRLQNQILKQHRQLYLLRSNRVASVTEANKSYHLNVRLCSSSPQSNSTCSVHSLESRGLIQISGKDSLNLLQGLVTNDVSSLESKRKSLYAMLLNTQGRVLYDLLLYKMSDALDDDRILIECQKDIIPDLIKMMKMYKIRKKVDFDNVSDGYKIYAAFNLVKTETSSSSDKVYIYDDPRVNDFGCRIIAVGDLSGSSFLKNCSQDTEMSYHMKRYELGIGEGMLDFPFGNCTPLESNLALLNGVSFDKGCYIGQELTARTHHTGVIRKRLMPLQFQSPPELVGGARVLNDEGQAIGKFRNSVGLYGLALLRVLQVKKNVSVEGKDGKMYDAKVHRPVWWPPDLQT